MGFKLNPLTGQFDVAGSGTTVGIGTPIVGADEHRILLTDNTSPNPLLTQSAALTDGQVIIGSTGVAPVVANITGTVNQVDVINGPGSITLSTPQDIDLLASPTFASLELTDNSNQLLLDNVTVSAGAASPATITIPDVGSNADVVLTEGNQTVSGTKTFDDTVGVVVSNEAQVDGLRLYDNILDLNATGTLAIGAANSDIINVGTNATTVNIGNPTATVNILGSVNSVQATNLNVTDSLITINDGGAAGSAAGTGIEFEEGGTATGYIKTSADRNNIVYKTPAQAGEITMPGAASAETVAFVSYVDSEIATRATIELDNLGTTAINADLLPDTDVTRNIGAPSTAFNYVYANYLVDSTDTNYVNVDIGISLEAGNGPIYIKSLDPSSLVQVATTSTNAVNSGNLQLLTGNSLSANSGNIEIVTGTAGGTRGSIDITSNNLNILNNNTSIDSIASINLKSDGLVTIRPASTVAPTVQLFQDADNNYVGLKAPASGISSSFVLTLPVSDGTSDQVLKTNGSGQLSWRTVNDFSATGTFAAANNQVALANVTGFSFSQTGKAIVEVAVNATTPLYEAFDVLVIKKASSYELTYSTVGDLSQVVLTIDNSGQVQYTSGNYTGFISASIKFKKVEL